MNEPEEAQDLKSRTKTVLVPPATPQSAVPRIAAVGRELAVEIGDSERRAWLGEPGQAVRAQLRREAARVAPAYAQIMGRVAGDMRDASITAELARRYKETWGTIPA